MLWVLNLYKFIKLALFYDIYNGQISQKYFMQRIISVKKVEISMDIKTFWKDDRFECIYH